MANPQPSLDMSHGFMRSIIKNQIDRDNYHKEVSEKKEQARQETKSRSGASKNKRPEQARYIPPVKNQEFRATSVIFKLEYEDEWGHIHELPIRRCDNPDEVARQFGHEQDMDENMIAALSRRLKTEMDARS